MDSNSNQNLNNFENSYQISEALSTQDGNSQDQNLKTIDQVYEETGYGKYQIKLLILFSIEFMFGAIFLMMPAYFFSDPIFICGDEECKQDKWCKYKGEKSISDQSIPSITKEYQLYCDKSTWAAVGLALPYFGVMLGLFFFMWLSDNYGRRLCIGLAWLTVTFGSIMTISFGNLVTILIGFFITGFGTGSSNFVGVVMLNEISTGAKRSMSVCFLYVAFGIGELVIWPMTLVTQDWLYFNIYFLFIPFLLLNCMYFLVYESPKYLLQKDRQKSVKILQKIAKENGFQDYELEENQLQQVENQQKKKYSYIDLFRFRSLRVISFGMVCLSIGSHALYYGIQFSLNFIGADFAQNTFWVGLADFLGYLASDFVCPRFPRKRWLNVTLLLASAFCFSFALDPVPEECEPNGESCIQKTLQIIQAVLARFIVSFSFSFMVIWMQELYPTTVRSIGVGLSNALGSAGAQLTPFVIKFCENIGVNPVIVLGLFGILGCIPTFCMQETFQKPLKEDIEELQDKNLIQEEVIQNKSSVAISLQNA